MLRLTSANPPLARASQALAAEQFADALAAADEALAGPLDVNVPQSERGESWDYPERALALHCRGTALWGLGRHAEAIATLTDAIRAEANYYSYANRAIAKRDSGDADGAIADFTAALERRPNYAHALANRGRLHAARGEWREAELDLRCAHELAPGSEEARAEWQRAYDQFLVSRTKT